MAINDITRNLGPSVSQSHTSDAIGHAEDLSPIITNIDPDLTMYLSEFGEAADAQTLKFSWPTDSLRPPQDNAHLEKEEYESHEVGSMEYLENHTQRFVTSGYVTEAQRKVKKAYNEQDEFVRQRKKAFTEHARDIEYMLVNSAISQPESGSTPARAGGVPFFLEKQTLAVTVTAKASGVAAKFTAASAHGLRTGDFVYFDATTMPTGLAAGTLYYVRLDTTTPATVFTIYNTMKGAVEGVAADLVEPTTAGTGVVIVKNNVVDLGGTADYTIEDLNRVMEMCYQRGGNPTLAIMSPAKKRRFSTLVTQMTQINRGMKKERSLDLVSDVVETDYGMITAKSHRMYPDSRIDLMDMNYWDLKWFTRTHEVTGIAKTGSYDQFFIESWLGLQGTQPKSSGSVKNIKR